MIQYGIPRRRTSLPASFTSLSGVFQKASVVKSFPCQYIQVTYETLVPNRVGGKRSSFSPTFVFRPLTPPYMRFLFWVPFEVLPTPLCTLQVLASSWHIPNHCLGKET